MTKRSAPWREVAKEMKQGTMQPSTARTHGSHPAETAGTPIQKSAAGGDEAPQPPPTVLTIAGLDPSAGAGITADLKVFAAHHLYGVTAATALTVQSTAGVRRVEPVSATLLAETLTCLADDLPLSGIKIGMLASAANVEAVVDFLEGVSERLAPGDLLPVVLDPVLRSSSGHPLLAPEGLEILRTRLLPLVTCVTPNTEELLLLAGLGSSPDPGRMRVTETAALLAQRVPRLAIVATGGHLDQPDDYVLAPGSQPAWLTGEWVRTRATHGTGCAYSSALLCGLVAGCSVFEAATSAKHYVTEALKAATPIGQGGGSMHHLYAFSSPRQPSIACRQPAPGHTDPSGDRT